MSDLREALSKAMQGKQVENVIDEDESVIDKPNEDELQANADEGMFGESDDSGDGENDKLQASDGDSEDELADRLNDKPETKKDSDAAPAEPKQGDATSKSKDKPPVGWTPENREHWAKLPQGLKEQISKREKEVNQVLQDSSNARRFSQDFSKTIQPFQSLMIAEGATNPIQAVDALLRTAATLKMGSKQQKAERIAQLVRHYSVDIGELDNVLAGGPQQHSQNKPNDIQAEVERLVAQRLAPYEQQQQQQRQQQQQAIQQKAAQGIQAVAQEEFFNDVRLDMADILEVASRRGVQMTAKEAYDRAVQLNPEIQRVVSQRKNQGLQDKRNAASSIRGNRSGVAQDGGDKSLRELLEATWVETSSGRM